MNENDFKFEEEFENEQEFLQNLTQKMKSEESPTIIFEYQSCENNKVDIIYQQINDLFGNMMFEYLNKWKFKTENDQDKLNYGEANRKNQTVLNNAIISCYNAVTTSVLSLFESIFFQKDGINYKSKTIKIENKLHLFSGETVLEDTNIDHSGEFIVTRQCYGNRIYFLVNFNFTEGFEEMKPTEIILEDKDIKSILNDPLPAMLVHISTKTVLKYNNAMRDFVCSNINNLTDDISVEVNKVFYVLTQLHNKEFNCTNWDKFINEKQNKNRSLGSILKLEYNGVSSTLVLSYVKIKHREYIKLTFSIEENLVRDILPAPGENLYEALNKRKSSNLLYNVTTKELFLSTAIEKEVEEVIDLLKDITSCDVLNNLKSYSQAIYEEHFAGKNIPNISINHNKINFYAGEGYTYHPISGGEINIFCLFNIYFGVLDDNEYLFIEPFKETDIPKPQKVEPIDENLSKTLNKALSQSRPSLLVDIDDKRIVAVNDLMEELVIKEQKAWGFTTPPTKGRYTREQFLQLWLYNSTTTCKITTVGMLPNAYKSLTALTELNPEISHMVAVSNGNRIVLSDGKQLNYNEDNTFVIENGKIVYDRTLGCDFSHTPYVTIKRVRIEGKYYAYLEYEILPLFVPTYTHNDEFVKTSKVISKTIKEQTLFSIIYRQLCETVENQQNDLLASKKLVKDLFAEKSISGRIAQGEKTIEEQQELLESSIKMAKSIDIHTPYIDIVKYIINEEKFVKLMESIQTEDLFLKVLELIKNNQEKIVIPENITEEVIETTNEEVIETTNEEVIVDTMEVTMDIIDEGSKHDNYFKFIKILEQSKSLLKIIEVIKDENLFLQIIEIFETPKLILHAIINISIQKKAYGTFGEQQKLIASSTEMAKNVDIEKSYVDIIDYIKNEKDFVKLINKTQKEDLFSKTLELIKNNKTKLKLPKNVKEEDTDNALTKMIEMIENDKSLLKAIEVIKDEDLFLQIIKNIENKESFLKTLININRQKAVLEIEKDLTAKLELLSLITNNAKKLVENIENSETFIRLVSKTPNNTEKDIKINQLYADLIANLKRQVELSILSKAFARQLKQVDTPSLIANATTGVIYNSNARLNKQLLKHDEYLKQNNNQMRHHLPSLKKIKGLRFYERIKSYYATEDFNPLVDWNMESCISYELNDYSLNEDDEFYVSNCFNQSIEVTITPIKLNDTIFALCSFIPLPLKKAPQQNLTRQQGMKQWEETLDLEKQHNYLNIELALNLLKNYYQASDTVIFKLFDNEQSFSFNSIKTSNTISNVYNYIDEFLDLRENFVEKTAYEFEELHETAEFFETGFQFINLNDVNTLKLIKQEIKGKTNSIRSCIPGQIIQASQKYSPNEQVSSIGLAYCSDKNSKVNVIVLLINPIKHLSDDCGQLELLYSVTRAITLKENLKDKSLPDNLKKVLPSYCDYLVKEVKSTSKELAKEFGASKEELSKEPLEALTPYWKSKKPQQTGIILTNLAETFQITPEMYPKNSKIAEVKRYTANPPVIACFNWDKNSFDKLLKEIEKVNTKDEIIGSAWGNGYYWVDQLLEEAKLLKFIKSQRFYNQNNWETATNPCLSRLLFDLQRNEYHVELQPQIMLGKKEEDEDYCHGAEALIRRSDRTIFPDEFVPIFEEQGIVRHIDFFVLETVCQTLQIWKEKFGYENEMRISVNLSRVTLLEPDIVKSIVQVCDKYNIPHAQVMMEVTERVGLIKNEVSKELVNEFRENGFKISLDDFGSDSSNLAALSKISVDEVKVDKGLVDYIAEFKHKNKKLCTIKDEKVHDMVKKVISMCNEFKYDTITLAEGIENIEQAKTLIEFECLLGQGYYFDKPLSINDFFEKYVKPHTQID